MLVHARLGIPFIFFAYKHAFAILNILPYNDLKTKEERSCTPYEKAFDIKPRLLLYKVFGCPTDFKRHSPALKSEKEQMGTYTKEKPNPKSLTRHSHWTFT